MVRRLVEWVEWGLLAVALAVSVQAEGRFEGVGE